MIEKEIIDELKNNPDITERVPANKIRFATLEQNLTTPAILLTIQNKSPIESLNSQSQSFKLRLQIDIFAKNTLEAVEIGNLIRLGIDGLSTTAISWGRFINEFDEFNPDLSEVRKIQEYEFIYKEA